MSESQVVWVEEEEKGKDEAMPDRPHSLHCEDSPHSNQRGLNLETPLITQEISPSPSSQGTGLLSLPWEMVARIASHLPAQCVISVLPQVCRTLGEVGEDSSAWQLRAHRLTGSRASFPVGPRDDFDWPTACLEMEQLIACWAEHEEWVAKEKEKEERAEQEVEMEQGGDDGAEVERMGAFGENVGVGGAVEAVVQRQPGDALQQVGEIVMMGEGRDEDSGGVQHDGGGLHPERNRGGEEVEAAVPIREDQRNDGVVLDGLEAEERERNDHEVEERRESEKDSPQPRASCPLPALEHITLPSGHIADVNSVLLVGGEGAVCASGSRDRNVNLWDLRVGSRGTLLQTLGGRGLFSTHRGWVWCLAACGPLLASGSFDSTVRLWDLQAGGAERGLIRGRTAVLCLSCETDVLLAGTHDQRVSLFDTRVAEPLIKRLHLHSDAVLCLASDEQYILSGSRDQTVAVFDRRAGKLLQKVQLTSYMLSMTYSGREVWAGDNRGLVHTFSMQSGSFKPVSQFNVGHTSLVTGIHHSPGALYTCSSDRTIKVHLPCAPPRTLCTLRHQAGVNGLSVEEGVLAIASGDMNVEVWRPRN